MTPSTARTFYQTALLALLGQEHHDPTSRRFGAEADAAWSMFQGHLDAADRIDFLLRDAAVKHPAAFAPRTVFSGDPKRNGTYTTSDLPEDEPFGPGWQSPLGQDSGRQLWRATEELRNESPRQLWQRAIDLWTVTPEPMPDVALDASSRLLVIGAGAIAGLAERFLGSGDLDWGRQVVAAAAEPAGLQLAGIVPSLAGSKTTARVVGLDGDLERAQSQISGWRPDLVLRSASLTEFESQLAAAQSTT